MLFNSDSASAMVIAHHALAHHPCFLTVKIQPNGESSRDGMWAYSLLAVRLVTAFTTCQSLMLQRGLPCRHFLSVN